MRMKQRASRVLLIIEFSVALVVVVILLVHTDRALAQSDGESFIDLRPVYCAAAAMQAHENPYTIEPISSCERALGVQSQPALPATLPPYVFEALAPLSLLPFRAVVWGYIVVATVAFACAAFWTASLARIRWSVAAVALFWTGFFFAANLGQLSPIALAAVAGTAYFVERERSFAAGLIATVAFLQPTLALPVIAVLVLTQPRARAGIACGLGVVAALSLLAGLPLDLLYLRGELPSQAAAEVYMPLQFSATWLAASFGASPATALRIGSITYALALLFAVFAGIAFTRRGRPALAILYAASAVTIGGTYLHLSQLAVALPTGLLLASLAQRGRTVIAAATCVLGTEWLSTWYQPVARVLAVTFLKSGTESLVLASLLNGGGTSRARSALAGALFVAASLGVAAVFARLPADQPAVGLGEAKRIASAGPLLSDSWRAMQEQTYRGRFVARLVATKALPWLAVVVIVAFGAAALADDSLLGLPQPAGEVERASSYAE